MMIRVIGAEPRIQEQEQDASIVNAPPNTDENFITSRVVLSLVFARVNQLTIKRSNQFHWLVH